jgi:hypothetical protein
MRPLAVSLVRARCDEVSATGLIQVFARARLTTPTGRRLSVMRNADCDSGSVRLFAVNLDSELTRRKEGFRWDGYHGL